MRREQLLGIKTQMISNSQVTIITVSKKFLFSFTPIKNYKIKSLRNKKSLANYPLKLMNNRY